MKDDDIPLKSRIGGVVVPPVNLNPYQVAANVAFNMMAMTAAFPPETPAEAELLSKSMSRMITHLLSPIDEVTTED